MTQFFAYKNPNPASRKQYPYLLDIQSDLLSELRTTVVIPLVSQDLASGMTISRLNPEVKIKGEKFIAITQDIAGIDRQGLGTQAGDLTRFRTEIVAAIDFLLSGI
jgi:toxin CcdB